MVNGKKLAEETAMPSVLEDDDAGAESEKLQLGEVGTRPGSQVGKAATVDIRQVKAGGKAQRQHLIHTDGFSK